MQVIKKYHLNLTIGTTLELPHNSKILKVSEQQGILTLWISQEVDAEFKEERKFLVYATCEPYNPEGKTYIGTVFIGEYVWHVFEVVT